MRACYRYLSALSLCLLLIVRINCAIRRDFSLPAFNAPALHTRSKVKTSIPLKVVRKLPSWPAFGRFPEHDDFSYGTFSFEWASWCYTSTGDVHDASSNIIGEDGASVGDAVAIARLFAGAQVEGGTAAVAGGGGDWRTVAEGERSTTSSYESNASMVDSRTLTFPPAGSAITTHYLAKLAHKKFSFDAISKKLSLNLNYARTFHHRLCSLSIDLPIILHINKIDMTRVFGSDENDILRGALGDDFFTLYPAGLPDFYEDILYRKGMITKPQNFRLGIGDIAITINRRLDADVWDFGIVGLGVVIPTARSSDRRYVWPAELGDGGFWSLRAHTGYYWRRWRLFNPHVFMQGRVRFLTSLDRRMSEIIYGIENEAVPRHLPFVDADCTFSQNVIFNESNVPALAQSVHRIEFRKGPQVNIRIGNMIDDVFLKRAYLDVYYEFMGKMEDSLGFTYDEADYNGKALMKNTERLSHTAGFVYSYQHNDSMRLEVGGNHVFAGESVLRIFSLHGGLQFNF